MSFTGRADLLRALLHGPELQSYLAELIGFERKDEPPTRHETAEPPSDENEGSLTSPTEGDRPVTSTFAPAPVLFWRPDRYLWRGRSERATGPSTVVVRPGDPWTTRPVPPPATRLASPASLLTRLQQVVARPAHLGEPDIDRAVELICRGELMERLPRRPSRGWIQPTTVLLDRSQRLAPYWAEQDLVVSVLSDVVPADCLTLASIRDGQETLLDPKGAKRPFASPPAGSLLLVLGDLGCLSANAAELKRFWVQLAHAMGDDGSRPVALLPAHPGWCAGELAEAWTIIPWQPVRTAEPWSLESRDALVERLVTLCAVAIRIEPSLLREVRLLLRETCEDPGLESKFWQHPAVNGGSSVAAMLLPTERLKYLEHLLSREPDRGLVRTVVQAVRTAHAGLDAAVWFEEALSVGPAQAHSLLSNADRLDAVRFVRAFAGQVAANVTRRGRLDDSAIWYREFASRLPRHAWKDPDVEQELHHALNVLGTSRMPLGVDPGALPPGHESRRIQIHHREGDWFWSTGSEARQGSPIAWVESTNLQVEIADAEPDDLSDPEHFWADGIAPPWAARTGIDAHGLWVEFDVTPVKAERSGRPTAAGTVSQRMRWIPAGSFRMGSGKEDRLRYKTEAPRHEVRISRGFWMFDSLCTQALWQAVMGANPSRFQSSDRPVDRVSWNDCQAFVSRIGELVPGLTLELPTEAEWEYACRAGVPRATYAGPMELIGERNAPVLDPIAWYGGNSGLDFELASGYGATFWEEKQHPFETAGSHPVRRKLPNAWGLYDMLGNLDEWCADGMRAYRTESMTDPVGPTDSSDERVVRGGAWNSKARAVRATNRRVHAISDADDRRGFRARLRGAEPSLRAVMARSGRSKPALSANSADGGTTGGVRAAWVSLEADVAEMPVPSSPAVRIVTDLEELTVRQFEKPVWASAIGRDRFGLWAEFEVPAPRVQGLDALPPRPRAKPGVVTQRLRWIPPGRFRMGSPLNEPGRSFYDEFEPHWQQIARGFWMFDTPCTQALWEAVMGEKPSDFKSPTRPVEQVDWHQSHDFGERISRFVPGLRLALPTEVQWEYACRAGTETATYAGPIEILGDAKASTLDPIAWYAGNCGVDFELSNGVELPWGKDNQYAFERGGTHPVGLKRPNAWGLYDMLGNVWEWCEDAWRGLGEQPRRRNDERSADPDADRVFRGGSWLSRAGLVRAASRLRHPPGNRVNNLGLRCVVQAQSEAEPGSVEAGASAQRRSRQAETAEQRAQADTRSRKRAPRPKPRKPL